MGKQKAIIWIIGFFAIVVVGLYFFGSWVYEVDPFFHYHAPLTEVYYYELDNERSQNPGIVDHFEYNAIITGTSMTENFKTTEFDEIFGVSSIKVPFSGGRFKETNDIIARALKSSNDIKIVVRSLDINMFGWDKDAMRTDMGRYPQYLYDNNILTDVEYLCNRDVIFNRAYRMKNAASLGEQKSGITDFNSYSYWGDGCEYGALVVIPEGISNPDYTVENRCMTDEEKKTVLDNVRQNLIEVAQEYPDVEFYYFLTPYSAVWWRNLLEDGILDIQVESEELAVSELINCSNIKVFAYSDMLDVTTNLDNYKDVIHYGAWINSDILRWMRDDVGLLTLENYQEYFANEKERYYNFDYETLNY